MNDPVPCFFLSPTGRYRVELRRYHSRPYPESPEACPGRLGYHDAEVTIGVETHPAQPASGDFDHSDPRWPKHCACGYEFSREDASDDRWQINHHEIYSRSDGGPECVLSEAQPGAIWDAYWMRDPESVPGTLYCGPDGLTLVIVLPTGEHFTPEAEASNGEAGKPGWVRTGVPPKISTTPSIQSARWHGYLTDGVLKAC